MAGLLRLDFPTRRWHRRRTDYFVYILRCADGALYVGHAEDVERHASRQEAAARERQIKRWTRRKKEALVAGNVELLKQL